jgi:hypothetical protein
MRDPLGGTKALAPLLLALLAGCATTPRMAPMSESAELRTSSGQFRLEYSDADAKDALRVQRAVEQALPKLARWGSLRESVTLRVLPSHAHLAAASGQRGMDWLRAWSRYDEVLVQAPATWDVLPTPQRQIDELILHELTHSLMYQLAADRLGWSRKRIPLWFREGMASYTADQAYRWVTLEDVARHLETTPGSDPLRKPNELYREDSNLVYGVAHHAFTFLVRRYGEDSVREVLGEMKRGKTFPEAFESAIGLTPDAFVSDFTRYVRWRGFRQGRLRAQ